MDWIVLIRLPDSALTKITYKGERIQCVPVSKETGKEWQAPRRKQSSGTVELSSCWGSRISSAAVQLAFCFLCFTFNAAGESGAALVLTTRGLWKRDCKRGQCSNVTNQILSGLMHRLKEKESVRSSAAILRKTQVLSKEWNFLRKADRVHHKVQKHIKTII